jgi:hypothetical protein
MSSNSKRPIYVEHLIHSQRKAKVKSLTATLLSFVIVTAMAIASSRAIAEPYLFDLLANPTYYKSWNKLLAGEKDVDLWLAKYAKTKDGPASPGKETKLGQVSYLISTVCKTHDCGENQFFVLFAPNGTHAWGLLLINRQTERFFGDPDDEKKRALRASAYE